MIAVHFNTSALRACPIEQNDIHIFQVKVVHGTQIYVDHLPIRNCSKGCAAASWTEVVLANSFVELIHRHVVQRTCGDVKSVAWSVPLWLRKHHPPNSLDIVI